MIKLLKKQPTVEEIHAEFDSAEQRILKNKIFTEDDQSYLDPVLFNEKLN